MRGMADKAWAAGWNVVRLNQRNCGSTEHLSRGLYHSGLTHDPLFVHARADRARRHPRDRRRRLLARRQPGAEARRRAGRRGAAAARGGLRGLADDGPGACVDALERRANFPYQWNFVRNLKARMRRKAAAFPADYSLEALRRIWTVRAVRRGLHGAAPRLPRRRRLLPPASAMRVVDRIRVPALILTAEDDPFVPVRAVPRSGRGRQPAHHGRRHAARRALRATSSVPTGEYDGYWAEREVVRFVEAHRGAPSAAPAELRTLPFFFVLEVDEHVAAACRPLLDDVGPARDVVAACSPRRAAGNSRSPR